MHQRLYRLSKKKKKIEPNDQKRPEFDSKTTVFSPIKWGLRSGFNISGIVEQQAAAGSPWMKKISIKNLKQETPSIAYTLD